MVALDTTGEIGVVRAVLEATGDGGREALEAAETNGAVLLTGSRVTFVDERHRAAIVTSMSPTARRDLHRTFADVLLDPSQRVQRAEHLASAAIGPDEEASAAFADLGREASARGDAASAAELFLRASRLATSPAGRAEHLYFAGDSFWNAAQYAAAREAFEAAYIGSVEPILRADIALQLGQLDLYQRGPRAARDVLLAAAEAVEPHDADRAAMLVVHAAGTALLSSNIVDALGLARRACSLAALVGGNSMLPASLMMAFLCLQHGDFSEFTTRLPEVLEAAEASKDSEEPVVDLFLQLVGMIHVYTEQWDKGRVHLTCATHRAGRRARFATAALATATLAELCWRSGHWDEAWSLATSEVVTEVTLTGARVWLVAFTAHLDAGFGRADDCRARARAALRECDALGFDTAAMWANHALGLLELGLGNPGAAAAHLGRIDAMATAHEIIEPSGVWWQADHVEALVRSGRHHEATAALARFRSGAALSHLAWASATSARCRALMAATTNDAERGFAEALQHHERLAAPFELARTLLCRAERRIALESGLDPSLDLSEAIAIFDSLGAVTWSSRSSALLHHLTLHA